MFSVDFTSPINAILMGLSGLVILLATYYVNRLIRRSTAQDIIDEAVKAALVKTADEPDPVTQALLIANAVQLAAPAALKTLNVDGHELREKVKERISGSRATIF